MSHTFTLCVDCGQLGENDITFIVSYQPGAPDVMYLSLDIRSALVCVDDALEALNRAAKAWNRRQLIDRLNSAKAFIEQAERALELEKPSSSL